MIFRQLLHEDLGCASYLIGDESAGVAAVVDPRLDIAVYLDTARDLGVRIERIFETHNHADHVSGHGRLAAATGATIHIHRAAQAGYAHEPFDDGDEWSLGMVRVRALHTPGHRPEHTALVVMDTKRSCRPWAVLTGDSLFVNDVARPDLAIEKTEGARQIFRTLHDKLLALPPDVELWPGHVGGSMCGGPSLDMKVCSTIGFERDHNPKLAIAEEERFVEELLAGLGPQPANFDAIVELNRGPLLVDPVELRGLTPEEVQDGQDDPLVIDIRPGEEFDNAHVPGAVSLPLSARGWGSRLAQLTDTGTRIIFVADDDEGARRAGRLAAAVGLIEPAGFLRGGMRRWLREQCCVERIARISMADLRDLLDRDEDLLILDVRTGDEWQSDSIPGSRNLPWQTIRGLPHRVDPKDRIAVVCNSGQRAGTAASLLQRGGAHNVIHVVDGGVPQWRALAIR